MKIIGFLSFFFVLLILFAIPKKEGNIHDFDHLFRNIERKQLEKNYQQKLASLPIEFHWIFVKSIRKGKNEEFIDKIDSKWNPQQKPVAYIVVIISSKKIIIQERYNKKNFLSQKEKDFIKTQILGKHFENELFYRGTKKSMDAIKDISKNTFEADFYQHDLKTYLRTTTSIIKKEDQNMIKHGLYILGFCVIVIFYFVIYQENFIRRLFRDFFFGKEELHLVQKYLPFKGKIASFKSKW